MATIIELYVECSWDARTRRTFVYAPDNWDTMSAEEREKFIQELAELWASQDIEIGGIAYDDPSEIDNSRWGDTYSEDEVEDFYGSKQYWETREVKSDDET